MAKKAPRRSARHEREQLGCMWGFISMFNFRHGRYAHRFLVDQRHGSKRASGIPRSNKHDKAEYHNEESHETLAMAVIKPSVKKLIEQELFIDKEIEEREMGQASDSEVEGRRRKNQRRKIKARGKSCDNFGYINITESSEPDVHRSRSNQKNHRSMTSLDIDNMIEEFCCEIHRRNTSHVKYEKHEEYKQRLRELVKFLVSQKLLHGNYLGGDSHILTSKDLMEVFQILGSDEELFLKLLRDPDLLVSSDSKNCESENVENNSTLFDKPNASERSDSVAGKKQSSFFRRKKRPQGRNDDIECESSERIIILKPGPASLLSPETGNTHSSSFESHQLRNKIENERFSSHFFLSEIKKKLKHVIKKDQKGSLHDGSFRERFRESVPTKDHFFVERMARPSKTEKKSQKDEDENKKQRVSNIYVEAKRHLSEMLNNGDLDPNSTSIQVQKTLGRMLSLPEYSSPLGSPGRRQDQCSSTAHRRSASAAPAMENCDLRICHSNEKLDNSIESLPSAPNEPTEEIVDKEDGPDIKDKIGSDEVIIIKEIEITPEEDNTDSNVLLPDQDISSTIESYEIADEISEVEAQDEQEDRSSIQISAEESQPPQSSSEDSLSSSLAKTEELKSGAPDLLEWSSPVSVLEPLFIEDDISPTKMRSRSAEALLQPLCIQFEDNDSADGTKESSVKTTKDDKELVFKYVKAVLDAIDSNWEELYQKSQSSDQLLEPALISNVPFCPNQLCSDHELLFDCINEVLVDLCNTPPWVSFVKPATKTLIFSSVKSAIHEAQEAVYWRLLPLPLPRSMGQIVRKDMVKDGNWLDVRDDVDCIGSETGEMILDELLDEFLLGMGG